MGYNTDNLFNEKMSILAIVVIIAFFLILAFFIKVYLPFKKKRDYIKLELARSFDKEEYLHWKRKLKMLYISKIPIVRSIVKRKYNR